MEVYLSGQPKVWRSHITKPELDTSDIQDMVVVRTKQIVYWRSFNGFTDKFGTKQRQRRPKSYMIILIQLGPYKYLQKRERVHITGHQPDKFFDNG